MVISFTWIRIRIHQILWIRIRIRSMRIHSSVKKNQNNPWTRSWKKMSWLSIYESFSLYLSYVFSSQFFVSITLCHSVSLALCLSYLLSHSLCDYCSLLIYILLTHIFIFSWPVPETFKWNLVYFENKPKIIYKPLFEINQVFLVYFHSKVSSTVQDFWFLMLENFEWK